MAPVTPAAMVPSRDDCGISTSVVPGGGALAQVIVASLQDVSLTGETAPPPAEITLRLSLASRATAPERPVSKARYAFTGAAPPCARSWGAPPKFVAGLAALTVASSRASTVTRTASGCAGHQEVAVGSPAKKSESNPATFSSPAGLGCV